ncbi:hypothetical protein [Campylobacter hyointestinalis]|uniref:hypothetical protein n=1 Tax=Campylobacter hyointestinalis TaxID=198 RepID=UPI00215CD6F1|nr:hypothetical protein [Campylobacter hyointestinalis]
MQEQYTEIKDSNIINKQNIDIAVGLGLVDDLKPSEYFYKAVEKSRTYNELEDNVKKYYDGKKLDKNQSYLDLVQPMTKRCKVERSNNHK